MRVLFFILILFFLYVPHSKATERTVEEYKRLCSQYHQYPDSLLKYGHELIALNSADARTEGYYAVGFAHSNLLHIDSALFYFKKGAALLNPDAIGSTYQKYYRQLSIASIKNGQYRIALSYTDTLLMAALTTHDSVDIGITYSTRSKAYVRLGEFEKSIADAKSSLDIFEKLHHPAQVNSMFTIAITYVHLDNNGQALAWFKKAYQKSLQFENDVLIDRSLNNLGTHYRTLNQLDSSSYYFNRLLQHQERLKPRQLLILYENLAHNAVIQKDHRLADSLIGEAYSFLGSVDGARTRKQALLKVHMRLEKSMGNYKEALQILDSAAAYATVVKNVVDLITLKYERAEMLEKLQKHKEAYRALKQYQSLKDSLSQTRDLTAIQEVIEKYQLKKKEMILERKLQNESGGTEYLSPIVVSLLLFTGLIFWGRQHFYKSKNIKGAELAGVRPFQLFNQKGELTAETGVRTTASQMEKTIILKSKSVVRLQELIRIESDSHYLNFYLENQSQPEVDRSSLMAEAEKLQDDDFIQVHRSHVVNIHFIKAVYSNRVMLSNGEEIPLSRTFRQKLKESGHPLFA